MAVTRVGHSVTENGSTVAYPAGWQAGDLLILARVGAFDGPDASSPTGFTALGQSYTSGSNSGRDLLLHVCYRFAQAGDSTSVSVYGNGEAAILAAYRGATAISASKVTMPVQASTVSLSSMSAPGGSMLIAFAGVSTSSGTVGGFGAPSGMTKFQMASGSTGAEVDYFQQAYASSATTGVKSFSYGGSDSLRTVGAVGLVIVGNAAPNAPILTAPVNNAPIDRNSVNRFALTPSDPDPGDSTSKTDWRYRLIGAPSWTTVTQILPQTYIDFAAGTFAAGDYEWQARTYDAQGVVGPYSPSSFFTAGDAPAAPTITAPVNGATFAASETVTWSAPNQDAYQLQVLDGADAVVSDTGEVTSTTARSRVVEFPVNNVVRKVRVRVKHDGLWSAYYTISGNVSWTPPTTPVVSLMPDNGAGSILVGITNPAPGAGVPATSYNDVYVDDGDGEERRATMLAPNSTWTYWTPKSGRDYDGKVRVVAVGSNGTTASS